MTITNPRRSAQQPQPKAVRPEASTSAQPKGATPHPTDVWIGKRIKLRRLERKMSQTDLGNALGVAFQQVQKYEQGVNRVSGSRLEAVATILKCDVTYFFPPRGSSADAAAGGADVIKFVDSVEALRLVRAFALIASGAMRDAIVTMAEAASQLPA